MHRVRQRWLSVQLHLDTNISAPKMKQYHRNYSKGIAFEEGVLQAHARLFFFFSNSTGSGFKKGFLIPKQTTILYTFNVYCYCVWKIKTIRLHQLFLPIFYMINLLSFIISCQKMNLTWLLLSRKKFKYLQI